MTKAAFSNLTIMEDSFYIDTLAENSRLEEKVKYLKEREAENELLKSEENSKIKDLQKELKNLKTNLKVLERERKASGGIGRHHSDLTRHLEHNNLLTAYNIIFCL